MNDNRQAQTLRPPFAGSAYLAVSGLPWEPTEHEGFWLKRLYEDEEGGEKTWLMKLDPGARAPSHTHEEFEQFYVLEGDFQDDHGTLAAGDFVCRPPGDPHWVSSTNGALVLLVYTRHGS